MTSAIFLSRFVEEISLDSNVNCVASYKYTLGSAGEKIKADEILHLHTSGDDIDTATNHPFYVIGKGWVAAGDLCEGDKLYLENGKTATVTGSELEKLDEAIKVYNLEVADYNTYFVGADGVLVHNYDSTDKIPTGEDFVASDGTVYPSYQNYKIVDPNNPYDWMEIHNVGRSHNGWLPHTHYPTYSTNPNTGKRYSNRKTSETTYGDHELMDYAIKALGWLFYTGGNLN